MAKTAFLPKRLPQGFEPGFYENATYAPEQATYPNGTHVCDVK
jgi:carbon-monoxide dehydrogenase large subunit